MATARECCVASSYHKESPSELPSHKTLSPGLFIGLSGRRKPNETQTGNVVGRFGLYCRTGGRTKCRQLAASRRQGDRRKLREFSHLCRYWVAGCRWSEFRRRGRRLRLAANGLQELYRDDRLRQQIRERGLCPRSGQQR